MERMVSPGVFTKENDLSFLEEGISEIGGAFVGPFLKGPAFRPVVVRGQDDFARQFGEASPDFYTPHAVKSYLNEASTATIVRVLGLEGYSSTTHQSLRLSLAPATGSAVTLAVIHPSRVGVTLASGSISGVPTSFHVTISGSNGVKQFTSMSIDPTSANYFVKVIGDAVTTKYDGYVYAAFPGAANYVSGSLVGSGSVSLAPATNDLNFSGSVFGAYSNASTPQIRSQQIGGQRYPLFKAHTLSDGNTANADVKISIASLRPPTIAGEYGTFSLLVRKFDDTDNSVDVLESHENLTLDPSSTNYIAQRIGTARTVLAANGDSYLEGDFKNNSKYIYIEMADGIESIPTTALPYGFDAPLTPLNRSDVPGPGYVTTRYRTLTGTTTLLANNKSYYGFDYTNDTSLSYLNALPSGSDAHNGLNDVGFFLDTSLDATDATDVSPTTASALRKFTVPLQGGFDGQNPAVVRNTGTSIVDTNTMGFDLSNSNKDGARAYTLALNALSNPEAYDINLLVVPGVLYSQHPYVATLGISMCEARQDCFYIMDAANLGDTEDEAVNAVSDVDSSYTATYHPWMKIRDLATNKTQWVPPSVLMAAVFAFSDRVRGEFFAPAGLHRGGISEALQVRTRFNQASRDVLYEGRVNPIASFPGQGIVAWGQKTLQHRASALDRINVRRLLIMVKKFIASSSRYLVFEQDTEATRNKFLNLVNPYLAAIQERQGLYAFKVVMDESNNTADLIDRNILVGQLFLKPTRSVEFISLEFNVLPTGAVFPN
jgi:phage tail sheath protein FI